MSEGREYISRPDEMGKINISEEVLAMIAAAAALEVEGVSALGAGAGGDMATVATRKGLSKTVHLSVNEDKVDVDISLLVSYGTAVPEVARAVQDAVISAVENTSGLQVSSVNVSVTGVTFQK
jgi:uncharacterized alkaline shock family protein YloU